MFRFDLRTTALGIVLLACGAAAHAADPWERFYGRFVGEGLVVSDGAAGEPGPDRRDLEVSIAPVSEGFNVTWVAVSHKADGRTKRKEYSIDFQRTNRRNVYESAMRRDLFGNREPLDPMRGDPYVWARIEGDTLSIFSLLITDSGGYEMQIYHRTVVEAGLQLEFARLREGEVMRTIQATLRRKN